MKGLEELRDIVRLLDALEATRGWVSSLPSEQMFRKALLVARSLWTPACIFGTIRRSSRNGRPRNDPRSGSLRRSGLRPRLPPRHLVDQAVKELRIVCSTAPSHEWPKFIEVEDETGKSRNVGEWREREDGLWELVVVMDTIC